MWRSLFLAVGIMLLIVGGECLLIDSAMVYAGGDSSAPESFERAAQASGTRQVTPSEWLPWTLLSSGAIVVIYAFALPRRWSGAGG